MAKGLDIGTANLVAASLKNKKVEIKRLRNSFIEISDEARQHLASGSLNAVHIKGKSYIVGDESVAVARILGRDARRPMAAGVLNPEEKDGKNVIGALIKALLGEPETEGERCCFSVPAVPVDNAKANNVWHTAFFSQLLENLGYTPEPVNEALAIIYAECADDGHTGISLSHGGGQVNCSMSYKLVGCLEFSVARSGDWIDRETASATGQSIARVLRVKEDPNFDLLNPDELDDEIGPALQAYYSSMIKYEIGHLVQQWTKMKSQLDFPEEIPIILSGGTALLKGFKDLWEKELNKFQKKTPLPFKVKEVRLAKDCLGSVARGLLTYALT